LQPGKREDVQLLEEWLKHVTQRTKCEDSDGHIADIDCSFVLHSIAFLEVVRQVEPFASLPVYSEPFGKQLYETEPFTSD
jgi:hypothetical protein